MAKVTEIYKCMECGNVVEVFAGGDGELVCCGEPMKNLAANTVDAAKEKHVPVIEPVAGGYKVKVGSVAHPMTEEHYIQFIELVCDCCNCVKLLNPGDAPEAIFECTCDADKVYAREHCNIHGLWKGAM